MLEQENLIPKLMKVIAVIITFALTSCAGVNGLTSGQARAGATIAGALFELAVTPAK